MPAATVRFASLEPLLEPIDPRSLEGLDWLIIGAQTGPGANQPQPEWVQDILANVKMPIYMKANLVWPQRRREFPTLTVSDTQ